MKENSNSQQSDTTEEKKLSKQWKRNEHNRNVE